MNSFNTIQHKMDTHSHDGGKSLGLVIATILLKGLAEVAPTEMWINLLTIIMLILAIAYHVLGIWERVKSIFKSKNE